MDGFPAAFLRAMRDMLGGEYDQFCEALSREPERGLRLNPARGAQWPGDVVPWEPDGRYVAADMRPGRDIGHYAGAYYMQDPSAMAPARVLDAQIGELVLDLCAAPGGKSGQIATALGGRGALVSNEPDLPRARALAGNLERLGVANALVVSAYPDALAKVWPERFDAVLVDAPCSGEGMFRRDGTARGEWTERAPAGFAKRQREILRQAAAMLRPGGRLVYSTCTFNVQENEDVVRAFLSEHPAFAAVDFALNGVGDSRDGMLRLWPHKLRGEGHFVARMHKAGDTHSASGQQGKRKDADARDGALNALSMLTRAVPGAWPERIAGWELAVRGNTLCALPPEMPVFEGLRALRTGLHLCQIGQGYVKPDHALAMAIGPGQARNAWALDVADAQRFVRGEALACPEALSGWVLVTMNGMPLGWGKATDGAMKNHVPKGVRVNL